MYSASIRAVKLRDPQNAFRVWKGWGLRSGQEQRTGGRIPAGPDFSAGFPPGKHPPYWKQIAKSHTMTPGKN